jgi:hypothetical protein
MKIRNEISRCSIIGLVTYIQEFGYVYSELRKIYEIQKLNSLA